ncbi:hypothetical protein DFJ43DRAFT_1152214 [Lentinula guzmanii]|uniref:Uncharacterized protein n=1 Tax=Lentinula guzmanii TaxID=2804957 RepID=A0AA38JQC9_9AGAR|nr:hypothetical protein DFJ43DRAFT_1152214 [Lentinula guzmanii]
MSNELAPILPTVPGTSGIDDLGGLAPSSTSTPEINGNLKRKRSDSTASLDTFIAGTVDVLDASSFTAGGEFTDLDSDFWKFVHDNTFTSFGENDNSAQMDAALSSVPGAPTSLTTGLSTGINTSVDGARVSCEEWSTNPVPPAAATQGDDVPVTSTSQTIQPSTQPTNYDELFGEYHSPIPNAGPSSTPAQDDLEAPLSTNNAEQADSDMIAEWQALLDVYSNDTSLAQASTPAAISDIQKIFLEGYEANSSGVPPSTYSGADIPFVGPADGLVGVSQVMGPLETMQDFSGGQLSSDTITNVPETGLNLPDQLSAFPGAPAQGFNNCLTPSYTSPFPIYPGSASHASEFRRMLQPPLVQHFPDSIHDTDSRGLCISTYRPHQGWYGIAHYFGVAPPPPATTIHSPFYDALINFSSTWNHNRGPLIIPSVLYDPPEKDILPIEIQRFMNQYFPGIPRPPSTYPHYVSWWNAVWIARECFRKNPQVLEEPPTTMGAVSFGQQSQPGPSHVPTTTTTIYWNPTPHDQTPVNINLNPAGHAYSSQTPLPTAEDLAKMEPHSIFVIETGQRERRPRKKARRE